MNTEFIEKNPLIKKIFIAVGVLLALFLLVVTMGKLKEYRFIGSGLDAKSTISVTGEGKIDRAPDTAKFSFTVRSEARELKAAQDTVSSKIDAVSKSLKDLGIEERYIKTTTYNSYPQYNYPPSRCSGEICTTSQPVLRGYEVAHTVTVSVKDLEKADDVLTALGNSGVSDISGPNFGFEDDVAIAREARALAIADAQTEAKSLARALNVKIVRIVAFDETRAYPTPMYATRDAAASTQKTETATLPIGDQNVYSSVTIVYEIQ